MKMSPIFGCNNFSNTGQHSSSLGKSVDVVKYKLDEARGTRCEWHCAEGAGRLETRGSPGQGDLCPVSHRPLRSHVTARHKTVVWRLAIDIKTWKNLKAYPGVNKLAFPLTLVREKLLQMGGWGRIIQN